MQGLLADSPWDERYIFELSLQFKQVPLLFAVCRLLHKVGTNDVAQSSVHPVSNHHLLRAMQLLTDWAERGWREPGPLISHGTPQAVRCRRIARSSQAL